MGGYNSGGRNRTHGMYEETPRLDSFELARDIRSSKKYNKRCEFLKEWWNMYGKIASASICLMASAEKVDIKYSLKDQEKKEYVSLNYVPNHYGGEKLYFLCPLCGRRIRFLCATERGFVCRKCANLNYEVQQSGKEGVLLHRIEKLLHSMEVETNL